MSNLIKKFSINFVISIPVFFAIAETTTGYFTGGTLNPGTIRGVIIGIFIIFFIFKYYPNSYLNQLILLFTSYFFILCFFSSNYSESFYGFFKFLIATLMFPLGYYFINSYSLFQKLNKGFLIALCLFIFNLIIANIFKLGTSDYLEDSVYFGAGRVNITKIMLIVLFASTNLLPALNDKQKKLLIAFLFVAAFFTIVGIKRSVLLSFGTGSIIFLLFNKNKSGFIKVLTIIIFCLLITLLVYPKAFNILESRFSAREERIGLSENVIETEGRVNEVTLVINSWLEGNVTHKLFGSELFNDRAFFNTRRMLHTDYMVVLNGSGIVGIILWFLIIISIFLKGKFYLSFFSNDQRFIFLKASFYAILISQILMSISGSIQAIGLRSYILLFLGAVIGTLRGELLNHHNIENRN